MQVNPDAIATVFATLFIDHPAPTGLSVFCNNNGTATPAGTQEANAAQYVTTLMTVIQRHSQFGQRDIYLAGESYAGRFLPAIATAMRHMDPTGVGLALKGMMIGNGEVDAAAAFASYGPFMYNAGFLSEPQRDELADISARCTAAVHAEQWAEATAICYTIRQQVSAWTGRGSFFDEDIRSGTDPFASEQDAVVTFLNREEVRQGLHAAPLSLKPSVASDGKRAWAAFNASGDFCKSAVPLLPRLLGNGTRRPDAPAAPIVRILLYTGMFDEVMNVLSTANWLRALPWTGTADFLKLNRTPWVVNGTTVAYVRTFATLSQLHVLRAGHFATKQQPLVLREAFARFVANDWS